MTTDIGPNGNRAGTSLNDLRFSVFSLRNGIFFFAVIMMNLTVLRPSPVDILYILSLLVTFVYMTLFPNQEVTKRAIYLILILASWWLSFMLPSLRYINDVDVPFELLSKTFAVSIGMIAVFVTMSWKQKHFETFMRVYIVSCVICATIGTFGFLTQNPLLTWDGRAQALINDPNMYGSFLIPAMVFCAYFLSRGQGSRILLGCALAMVLLGILLSFSRIAVVAALFCFFAYIFFHNRNRPQRSLMIIGGLLLAGIVMFIFASVTSAEFMAKLTDRLTFAKSYDLGEEGRYHRYALVMPMIATNPIGVGVLQLAKIFPEPIHNIWLSSFVNYGWGGGIAYLTLAIGSIIVAVRNYRRTRSELSIALVIGLCGIIFCSSLHEGEQWRHSWLFYGLVWGFNPANFGWGQKKKPAPAKPGPVARWRSAPRPAPIAPPPAQPVAKQSRFAARAAAAKRQDGL